MDIDGKNCSVTINGKQFKGDHISISNEGKIKVDGEEVATTSNHSMFQVTINNHVEQIYSRSPIKITGAVSGNVYSNATIFAKDIYGNVKAGNSIFCQTIDGKAEAHSGIKFNSIKNKHNS
ncbi:hypothetical protein JOC54_003152 [Alkalihalobacillus xiaoxiensis]|uniref:Cytoskeletal protein CcmA (Bactofilin family) n=1 Tax=Shouchella xiaoxiensis TaxID=766895 RepID=A0ABS2SWG4_9BACI|nr:hypothetical protein [Shouchella xiaoxiensis]MBM7839872.1 hypothetical protein [Shouchella xiaoxiensis]